MGQDYDNTTSSSSVAKFWKNGVESILPGIAEVSATGVSVKGSDVYISGYEYNGTIHLAKLWKNGVATTLSTSPAGGYASRIFVQ